MGKLYRLSDNNEKRVAVRGLHVKFALDERDMIDGIVQVLGECIEVRQYDYCTEVHVSDRHMQNIVAGIRDELRVMRSKECNDK